MAAGGFDISAGLLISLTALEEALLPGRDRPCVRGIVPSLRTGGGSTW